MTATNVLVAEQSIQLLKMANNLIMLDKGNVNMELQ